MGWQEIVFILILFLTNIIQTITGFAGTVLAMPLSLRLVGEGIAKPVLNLIALVTCLIVAVRNYKSIDWKNGLILLGFLAIGFIAGFGIEYLSIKGEILLKIYGCVIVLIAIFFFFFDAKKLKIPDWVLYIILIFAGILHEIFVSGGPLVVIYAMKKFDGKQSFRSTLSFIWVVLNSILFGKQLALGNFTPTVWMLFGIGMGAALISILIGKLIAKKLPLPIFMKITYVLLLFSGVSLLW